MADTKDQLQNYMLIFNCAGVSVLNSHIVQGSIIYYVFNFMQILFPITFLIQFLDFSLLFGFVQFSSIQSLSRVRLFATPWTAACQASLSITNTWSLPKLIAVSKNCPFFILWSHMDLHIIHMLLFPPRKKSNLLNKFLLETKNQLVEVI